MHNKVAHLLTMRAPFAHIAHWNSPMVKMFLLVFEGCLLEFLVHLYGTFFPVVRTLNPHSAFHTNKRGDELSTRLESTNFKVATITIRASRYTPLSLHFPAQKFTENSQNTVYFDITTKSHKIGINASPSGLFQSTQVARDTKEEKGLQILELLGLLGCFVVPT